MSYYLLGTEEISSRGVLLSTARLAITCKTGKLDVSSVLGSCVRCVHVCFGNSHCLFVGSGSRFS